MPGGKTFPCMLILMVGSITSPCVLILMLGGIISPCVFILMLGGITSPCVLKLTSADLWCDMNPVEQITVESKYSKRYINDISSPIHPLGQK